MADNIMRVANKIAKRIGRTIGESTESEKLFAQIMRETTTTPKTWKLRRKGGDVVEVRTKKGSGGALAWEWPHLPKGFRLMAAENMIDTLEEYELEESVVEADEDEKQAKKDRKKATDASFDFGKTYHKSLPVQENNDILNVNGFDGKAVEGVYTGREGGDNHKRPA